jgi:hypothetical protein
MRRASYVRGVLAVVVLVVLSVSVSARPRDERPVRDPRGKRDPIVKVIKKIIRSLGDGLSVPTP